jgi:hypothetical protein
MKDYSRSHHLIMSSEFNKLILPRVPELGETVEEHHQFPFAPRYVVEAYVIDISIFMFEHIFS